MFAHALAVSFWVGSLLLLLANLHDAQALTRFSRLAPWALALLFASGLWLAFAQLGRLDALWSEPYGRILMAKLAAVIALLALAARNRYRLVPRFLAGDGAGALRAAIAIELVLVLAILALVALWRFTPPPRALAPAAPVALHLHGEKAMAELEFVPQRGRGAQVRILVLDGAFAPLAAREVALALANPAAGIEPVRRAAVHVEGSAWQVEELRVPAAGDWRLRVEILIGDFERVVLEDSVRLPRLP